MYLEMEVVYIKKLILVILLLFGIIFINSKVYADEIDFDINWQIDDEEYSCEEVLGHNVTVLLKGVLNSIRIVGAIIVLVNAMIILIPPIANGDASALKKAGKKCVNLAIVLAIIGVLPSIVHLIGEITGFDTTCIL